MAKPTYEELEARLADVMGEGGSYRSLQVRLDEAIQKLKDQEELHARHIVEVQEAAAKDKAEAIKKLKQEVLVPALRAQHEAELAKLVAE